MKTGQLIPAELSAQDSLYNQVADSYGTALQRLARGYEADSEKRLDLLQEIHLALWQSFARYDRRCSLRTWVYRVAHNVGASHVVRDRRARSRVFVGVETLDIIPDEEDMERAVHRRDALQRLLALIQRLKVPDRQVILCYLEGMDAASIAEVVGLSPSNVATKIHRIKNILARHFFEGVHHGQ